MKKFLLLMFSVLILFTGCNKKKNMDGENFKSYMEKKGYSIHNVYKQYSSELVTSALIALNDKASYQIEFLEFKSEDYAKNSFQANRTLFRENKKDDDKEESVSKDNHSKYTLITDDMYYVISRKDNTLIYLTVDGSYKEDIDEILKDLGY